jgi:hypothetical protein
LRPAFGIMLNGWHFVKWHYEGRHYFSRHRNVAPALVAAEFKKICCTFQNEWEDISKLHEIRLFPWRRLISANHGPGLPDIYFFKPEILIWVNFRWSCNGKCWFIFWPIGCTYYIAIWCILRPFDIFYGHLVYFVVVWCIFPRFGILYQEKSGNPAPKCRNFVDLGDQLRQKLGYAKKFSLR